MTAHKKDYLLVKINSGNDDRLDITHNSNG